MKKLLLAAVCGALCMSDASAVGGHSLLHRTKSKQAINRSNKAELGNFYCGPIWTIYSRLKGIEAIAKELSGRCKAVEGYESYAPALTELSKSAGEMARYPSSVMYLDRTNTMNSNLRKFSSNVTKFTTSVSTLMQSPIAKECGPQLRADIIEIANALRSLKFPEVQFNVAGVLCSSDQGWISGNGNYTANNYSNLAFNQGNAQKMSNTFNTMYDQVDGLLRLVGNTAAPNVSVPTGPIGTMGTAGYATANYATPSYNYSAPAAAAPGVRARR